MESACNFITAHLNIPAAYIALKKISGEKETLNYIAASKGQEFVIGCKITKVTEEGDELPPRQGFSFDAFKIPEPAADDAPAEEETDEGAPPKPPPVPVPLVIDNVMRDRRCSFFGIPKLGAFVAVPLSYQTTFHENGCLPNPDAGVPPAEVPEGGETPLPTAAYLNAKISQEFILGFDSIGKYRTFKTEEIKLVEGVGAAMLSVFATIDDGCLEAQTSFLEKTKAFNSQIPDGLAKLPEAEAAAIATVAAELAVPEGTDPPPEPAPDSLKPYREAAACCKCWNSAISGPPFSNSIDSLINHILPASQAASNLVYAIGCLVNLPEKSLKDAGGDITWESVRMGCVPDLLSKLSSYDPSAQIATTKEASLAAIKSFCEANNVFDASQYPAHVMIFGPLALWLGKALAARETAILYFKEVKQMELETFA